MNDSPYLADGVTLRQRKFVHRKRKPIIHPDFKVIEISQWGDDEVEGEVLLDFPVVVNHPRLIPGISFDSYRENPVVLLAGDTRLPPIGQVLSFQTSPWKNARVLLASIFFPVGGVEYTRKLHSGECSLVAVLEPTRKNAHGKVLQSSLLALSIEINVESQWSEPPPFVNPFK